MKLLICFRDLPYAETTIRYAGMIGGLFPDSELVLLSVGRPGEAPDAVEARLAQGARLLDAPVVRLRTGHGEVLPEILRLAAEERPDIIVVGSRLLRTLLEGLMATVTDKVVDRARASVLVVRGRKTALRRILVAVGGRELRRAVVEQGTRLAKAAGAEVTLLYVADPVPAMYAGLDAMEERLAELLQSSTPIASHLRWSAQHLDEMGVSADLKMRHGVATNEILREIVVGGYDLAVIGARSVPGVVGSVFMKRVTPRVVELAECPVLVVRPG